MSCKTTDINRSVAGENALRLHPEDEVKVIIMDDSGILLYTYDAKGYRHVEDAAKAAYEASGIDKDIRDLTFRVTNLDTRHSARYRFNAHDRLHLIV